MLKNTAICNSSSSWSAYKDLVQRFRFRPVGCLPQVSSSTAEFLSRDEFKRGKGRTDLSDADRRGRPSGQVLRGRGKQASKQWTPSMGGSDSGGGL